MLSRYFPEKQLYVRNRGEVYYFILKGRTQLALSVGLLLIMLWSIITAIDVLIVQPYGMYKARNTVSIEQSLALCKASLGSYQNLKEWNLSEDQSTSHKELERLDKENEVLKDGLLCSDLSSLIDKNNEIKLQLMSQNNIKLRSRVVQLVDDRDKLFQLLAEKSPEFENTEASTNNFGQRILYNSVNRLDSFLNGSNIEVIYTKKELTDKVLQATYVVIVSFFTVIFWFVGIIISRKKWIKQTNLPEDLVTNPDTSA